MSTTKGKAAIVHKNKRIIFYGKDKYKWFKTSSV